MRLAVVSPVVLRWWLEWNISHSSWPRCSGLTRCIRVHARTWKHWRMHISTVTQYLASTTRHDSFPLSSMCCVNILKYQYSFMVWMMCICWLSCI